MQYWVSVFDANVSFGSETSWDCTATGDFETIDTLTLSGETVIQRAACDTRFSLSRVGANCQLADAD